MLADLFKKWNKQLKNISKNAYDFSKEQTKGLKVVKKDITKVLLKEKLYPIVKPYYEYWLGELYTNIQLFK